MRDADRCAGSDRPRVLFVTFAGREGGPQAWFSQVRQRPEFERSVSSCVWKPGDLYRGITGKPRLIARCRRKYEQAGRPPVVYVSLDLDFAAQIVTGMRIAGAPCIVVHAHATRFGSQRSIKMRAYRWLVRVLGDRKAAVSEAAARAMFGRNPGTVELLPAFIDFDALWRDSENPPCPAPPSGLQEQDRGFVFACVGRLAASKNLSLAIDAFARFRAASGDGDARLLLIGSGPDESALRAQCERAGLTDGVHFTGWVDSAAWYYRHAVDCLLMPSLHEGAPRAVLEAQAFGCRVVVSEAVPEFCLYRQDLALRPETLEPDAWASSMRQAAEAGGRAIGNSIDIARGHPLFSIEQVMPKFLALLQPGRG